MKRLTLAIFTLLLGAAWVIPAQAVPAFARQTGKKCSYCHTSWPQLNRRGMDYKESGYLLGDADEVSLETLWETAPVGFMIKARPLQKNKDQDNKMRAFHEAEFFVGGRIAENVSGYVEFEAEDDEGNFNAAVGMGSVGYHYNQYLNVRATWGPIFFNDPYGLLSIVFNTTGPIRPAFLDNKFGKGDLADGRLRKPRQMVSLSGRAFSKKLFYDVVYAGASKDVVGSDARTWYGRMALDVTENIMIGGYGMSGSTNPTVGTVTGDYERYGVDGRVDWKDFRLNATYLTSQDNLNTGAGDVNNDFVTVEAMYTFHNSVGRPTWVPLIRYDSYEMNDGASDYDSILVQLSYHLTENTKAWIQYWDLYNTPTGVADDNQVTFEFAVGF